MLKYSTRQDITVRKQSDKPTPKGSIASGAVWSILDNVAAQGITFVIFLVLARLLDPHLYGMLSVSILITQLFRTVIFESIATSIIRKHEPTDEDFNTAFLSCCIFAVPAFLIVFFSANILENMMHIQGLGDVIRGTSVIILVSGLSKVHEAWLTHRLLFRSLAIRSITSIGLGGIVGVYLAWKGMGITSLVMQQVVTSVVATITLWLATPWKPRLRFSMASFKESMRFSRHVALSGMTNFANQNSDIFFITYYLGSAAAGVYSAGKRIVNTLNTVMATALMRVSLPAFSRVKNQLDEFKSHYLNATFFTILLTAPAFIGLCYLSHGVGAGYADCQRDRVYRLYRLLQPYRYVCPRSSRLAVAPDAALCGHQHYRFLYFCPLRAGGDGALLFAAYVTALSGLGLVCANAA